jgi:hypothetical protein
VFRTLRLRASGVVVVQVSPITHYVTELTLELRRQIAANDNYICYALKQGQLRLINRTSAARALLKGHVKPITDLRRVHRCKSCCIIWSVGGCGRSASVLCFLLRSAWRSRLSVVGIVLRRHWQLGGALSEPVARADRFFGDDVDLLASAGKDSLVVVWRISEAGEDGIVPQQLLKLQLSYYAEPLSSIFVSWHPRMQVCERRNFGVCVFVLHLRGSIEWQASVRPTRFDVPWGLSLGSHSSEMAFVEEWALVNCPKD